MNIVTGYLFPDDLLRTYLIKVIRCYKLLGRTFMPFVLITRLTGSLRLPKRCPSSSSPIILTKRSTNWPSSEASHL